MKTTRDISVGTVAPLPIRTPHGVVRGMSVLLAFAPALPAATAEVNEPNDTLATATTTGLVGLGTITVTDARVGDGDWPERDVDIYSFVIGELIPLPVVLTVEVVSSDPQLDAFLRLFDGSGAELTNNDDRTFLDRDPHLQTYLLASGTYYVGISTSTSPHYDNTTDGSGRPGTGGTYTMSIFTKSGALPDSRFEPNDYIYSASPIGTESFTAVGEFIGDGDHGRRDVDIYRLTLDDPARIEVEVRTKLYGSMLDPAVRLRNCEDGISERTYVDPCLLGADDDRPNGSHEAAIAVGVLEHHDVYIMVSGAGNRRYDPATSGSGEMGSVGYYDLVVTVTYLEHSGIDEPNDSTPMAIHLSPFVTGRPEVVEIEGFIGDGPYAQFEGDRDFYEVTMLDETRFLTVDVAAESIDSALDPVVVLYDFQGRPVASNDNFGDSVDARLVLPVACIPVDPDVVSAYVMVMGTKQRFPNDPNRPDVDEVIIPPHALGDGPGSTGPYHLTLSVGSVDPCGGEPNDILSTATNTGIVDQGSYVCSRGWIGDGPCEDPELDADMWSVNVVHAPALLRVEVAACRSQPEPLDYSLIRVFDSNGVELTDTDPEAAYTTPNILQIILGSSGTYYIGVTGRSNYRYDPQVPCSVRYGYHGEYDILIALTQGSHRAAPPGSGQAAARTEAIQDGSPLFATRLDDTAAMIEVVDPGTGDVTVTFSAPEPRFSASEGLAYDGTHLYYVGVGQYPKLYQLDPLTGAVLDEFLLWVGSGYYSDATMLDGELYLLDYRGRSVHVIDPIYQRFTRTLRLGSSSGITVGGGLAALAGPDRLYVADAFDTRSIYEVDPQSGLLTNVLPPLPSDCCVPGDENTSCCADVDCCQEVCSIDAYCCDWEWDGVCAEEANDLCEVCATTPRLGNRPIALAGIGASTLYVGDWESQSLELIDRAGSNIGETPLATPIGSLAGEASVGPSADFDRDGDIDLLDYAILQRCFTGTEGIVNPGCEPGDRNGDGHVDLPDFAVFPNAATGPL
ncbi:MAG: hypothetical protein JSU86_10680 [Phycisphaerales bacterium]|nr:MAG: hypothetical protein JSU86_10680 [Phycisphaerales bacterium]